MNRVSSNPSQRKLSAIILAAGKGTRMGSDLPKVVHRVAGEPMVKWVVDACREVGAAPIVLVVGHGADQVREVFEGDDGDLRYAVQEPQLGTGHAVMQAKAPLDAALGSRNSERDVVVLAGDGPLIRAQTLRTLIDAHRRANAAATLATATIDDAAGYGRIVRDAEGRFRGIVEHRDASPKQLEVREVNPSYYIFRAGPLFEALSRVGNDNAKGEYYLTDVFALLLAGGEHVEVIEAVPPEDVLSINTPEQLAEVGRILGSRLHGAAAGRRTPA